MSEPSPAHDPRTDPSVLRAKSPADLLAVVPYRVGFHPTESLVVMTVTQRSRLGFTVRVDLPPPALVPDVADQVCAALARNDAARVLMVAYAPTAEQARPLVEEMRLRLDVAAVDLVEAMRADGERWFSYTCTDPSCCPEEGTAYDNTSHPLAAQAVVQGEVALPDRAALEESVAPVRGIAAVSMAQAAARAEDDLAARSAAGQSPEQVQVALLDGMRALVEDYLRQPRRLDDDTLARAAVWARFSPVRDVAWQMMSRADAVGHLGLWRQVLRRVPPPYEPAAGCLTAFAAWLTGDGALAVCALERALDADPDYPMAALIDQTLRAALPPSSWGELPTAM